MTATWYKLLKPLVLGLGLVALALLWLGSGGPPLARAAGPLYPWPAGASQDGLHGVLQRLRLYHHPGGRGR